MIKLSEPPEIIREKLGIRKGGPGSGPHAGSGSESKVTHDYNAAYKGAGNWFKAQPEDVQNHLRVFILGEYWFPKNEPALAGAMESCPKYEGTTFRGTTQYEEDRMNSLKDLEAGDEFKFGYLASTSPEESIANEFMGARASEESVGFVKYEIQGARGVAVDGAMAESSRAGERGYSEFSYQKEITMLPDEKFTVVSNEERPLPSTSEGFSLYDTPEKEVSTYQHITLQRV